MFAQQNDLVLLSISCFCFGLIPNLFSVTGLGETIELMNMPISYPTYTVATQVLFQLLFELSPNMWTIKVII